MRSARRAIGVSPDAGSVRSGPAPEYARAAFPVTMRGQRTKNLLGNVDHAANAQRAVLQSITKRSLARELHGQIGGRSLGIVEDAHDVRTIDSPRNRRLVPEAYERRLGRPVRPQDFHRDGAGGPEVVGGIDDGGAADAEDVANRITGPEMRAGWNDRNRGAEVAGKDVDGFGLGAAVRHESPSRRTFSASPLRVMPSSRAAALRLPLHCASACEMAPRSSNSTCSCSGASGWGGGDCATTASGARGGEFGGGFSSKCDASRSPFGSQISIARWT